MVITGPPARISVNPVARGDGNKALIEHAIDLLNKHDLDAYYALFAPESAYRRPGPVVGPPAMRAFDQQFWDVVPDHHRSIEQILVDEDFVVAWVRVVGNHTSGSAIDVAFLNVFQVDEGKIVNLWMYFDSAEMARQLGR